MSGSEAASEAVISNFARVMREGVTPSVEQTGRHLARYRAHVIHAAECLLAMQEVNPASVSFPALLHAPVASRPCGLSAYIDPARSSRQISAP